IQAGASPIQFTPYITGTSNQGVTCSLSSSSGANGTITANGLYTPADTATVTVRTDVTMTCTSTADPTKSASKSLIILPVDGNGITRIALGKYTATSDFYLDQSNNKWYNDFVSGKPTMWPNLNGFGRTCGPGCSGGNFSTAPGLYNGIVLDTIGE